VDTSKHEMSYVTEEYVTCSCYYLQTAFQSLE